MTNETAYQIVRKFINTQFEEHKRFVDQHNRLAAKGERDRVLSILATLRTEEPAQPTLLAEPMPVEYSPGLSQKLDRIDQAIESADNAGKFANATALRARKSQMLRSIGA